MSENKDGRAPADGANQEILRDVELDAVVEVGRAKILGGEFTALREGAVIELDHLANEPFPLYVGGLLVGRGEIVQTGDRYGFKINELVAISDRGRQKK